MGGLNVSLVGLGIMAQSVIGRHELVLVAGRLITY